MTRVWYGRAVLLVLGPVALVFLWWWTSKDSTSYLYPPLTEILETLREDWLYDDGELSQQLSEDLAPSMYRFAVGYLLAGLAGVTLGTLLGLATRLRQASLPVTEFLRSIPPTMLVPFIIVTLGIGDDAKVALIVIGSMWPVVLNTADGVRGVDVEAVDMARSYGLGRRLQVTRVILPGASPKIMVGLRTALSVALILMVVSEMTGATNGLGFQTLSAQRRFDSAATYAGVIVIGCIGLAVNLAFLAVERWIMRWHRGARGLLDTTGAVL